MTSPTIEEYLETIFVLEAESPPVKSARVAESMGVSAPTMTDTLKRLVQQGYVRVGHGKVILLTDKGRETAAALVRRHRLSERWLVDVLGMDWSRVHQDACRLEHALSPEVEERLAETLDHPSTCPHGNPIPGLGTDDRGDTVPLDGVSSGQRVVLVRVSRSAEENPDFLDFLKSSGLVPGAEFTVAEVSPWAGTLTLSGGEVRTTLGLRAASHLRVRVAASGHDLGPSDAE